MSLRLQLTLLFVLLLAGIGMVRVGAVIWGFSQTLEQMAFTETSQRIHQVQAYLTERDEELAERGERLKLRAPAALPRAFSDDGMYLQLMLTDGTVLNRSPNLDAHALPAPTQEGASTITLDQKEHAGPVAALLVSRRMTLPGREATIWVQAAYPLADHRQTISRLAMVEIGGWLGALMLALVGGYFFAGRVLRPVAAMTAEVRALGSTDLHRRLPVAAPPHDEIAQLAVTFNGLFERLERAFTVQRRFVADASHELKSPLTTIRGNLQLLKRHGAARPEEAVAWTETALREVDRLTRMVNALLLLARNDEGAAAGRPQPVDLAALAREVARQHPGVAVSADGPATVLGHADRLRQVLINLVDNALRATREGGGVELAVAAEAGAVGLVVSDGGIGMPPEALPHIFDRFYRVDAARDRAAGGTGLGLAIVKEIVEGHGGTIAVESRPGAGTTFNVRLPRYDDAAAL